MKKLIPALFYDFLLWQKIKYLNRSDKRENIISEWIKGGKKEQTPHAVKQEIITKLQKKYSVKILVETGTFRGEMVYAQKNNFEKIISIELSEELFLKASRRFRKYPHIEIINGDSGSMLDRVVPQLGFPAIFWLDGHYSGFETAKGQLETPVVNELKAILQSHFPNIILIDDARYFNGTGDYPKLEELKIMLSSGRNKVMFSVEDDIIRILPDTTV